jgi:hypothetical protein
LEKAIEVDPRGWAEAQSKQRMIRSAAYETASALGLVMRRPAYRLLALIIFVPMLALYLFMLPSAFTAGSIGLICCATSTPSWRYFPCCSRVC